MKMKIKNLVKKNYLHLVGFLILVYLGFVYGLPLVRNIFTLKEGLTCNNNELLSEKTGICVDKPWSDFKSCSEEKNQGSCNDNHWVKEHCITTCSNNFGVHNKIIFPCLSQMHLYQATD